MPTPGSRPSRTAARLHAHAVGAERINRRLWNRQSAEYDRRHAAALGRSGGLSWGLGRVPESRLRLLGDVRGRNILELGCGGARWSTGLRRLGAHPVGIDLSSAQLAAARRVQRRSRTSFPLVMGSVRRLPFRNGTFDAAFCDWGALTFADPLESIPEASRVLRVGGRLVFATASPFRNVVQARRGFGMGKRLRHPYFGLHRIDYAGEVNFQLAYGAWVDLFRSSQLVVERLVELPIGRRTRSTYLSRQDLAFGRHWPLESIWVLSKVGPQGRGRTPGRATTGQRPRPRSGRPSRPRRRGGRGRTNRGDPSSS